jgi:hypothetical protein
MRSGGDAPNAVRPIPNTLKGHEQSDFAIGIWSVKAVRQTSFAGGDSRPK